MKISFIFRLPCDVIVTSQRLPLRSEHWTQSYLLSPKHQLGCILGLSWYTQDSWYNTPHAETCMGFIKSMVWDTRTCFIALWNGSLCRVLLWKYMIYLIFQLCAGPLFQFNEHTPGCGYHRRWDVSFFCLLGILTSPRRHACRYIIWWVEEGQYVRGPIECSVYAVSYSYIHCWCVLLPHQKLWYCKVARLISRWLAPHLKKW